MTNTPDQLDLEGLESARTVVEKFLDQHAMMRGTDKEDIYGLHVGTDREAVLKASHLRSILLGLRASEAECETLKRLLRAANGAAMTEIDRSVIAEGSASVLASALSDLVALYEDDEGAADLPQIVAAKAALASTRTPSGEARPDTGEQWSTAKPPEVAGQYINVRTVTTFRWLPYKPDGARQMKKAGRWQQVRSEHGGWENADFPEGAEWMPNLPVSRVADTGSDATTQQGSDT